MDTGQVKIAGLSLEHPIMLAAGMVKTREDLRRALNSAASVIVVGSITVEAREGNRGQVYQLAPQGGFSVNSLGLPNLGAEYWREHLPSAMVETHAAGKLLIFSGAGFSPADYGVLAQVALQGGVDAFEANLGCPNVWDKGRQHRIASFEEGLIVDIGERVRDAVGSGRRRMPVWFKMSPFSDPAGLERAAFAVGQLGYITAVVTSNTFPNATGFDRDGRRLIDPAGGLGGLGGPALKPIGLGQVVQWRALLPARIQVVGVGGISTGQDVVDYFRAGADAVQIATAYLQEGERVFSRILAEFVERIG